MSHPIKPCPKCNKDNLYVSLSSDSLGRKIFRLRCPEYKCGYKSSALPSTAPDEYVFYFGKYRGLSIKEVDQQNPQYLHWFVKEFKDNNQHKTIVEKIQNFLANEYGPLFV